MKRRPGHASVEEHPKGSGKWRVRRRVNGRLVTVASGGFNGEDAASERVPGGTCVYFIADEHLVKIGWSGDPQKRLAQLRGTTGRELVLVGSIPGGRGMEALLHSCFSAFRTRGEWFHNCGEVTKCIAALEAE